VKLARRKSPWVYMLSQGTCNGCELECFASLCPRFDPERMGVRLVSSPRHADIVLLTGCGTKKAAEKTQRIFQQVPAPKVAIQIGACAINGGVFKCPGPRIPGEIQVEGCPPDPTEILAAIKAATEMLTCSSKP
jgi:membrane-bound hydrogenase subunit mbhJ